MKNKKLHLALVFAILMFYLPLLHYLLFPTKIRCTREDIIAFNEYDQKVEIEYDYRCDD